MRPNGVKYRSDIGIRYTCYLDAEMLGNRPVVNRKLRPNGVKYRSDISIQYTYYLDAEQSLDWMIKKGNPRPILIN